LDHNRVGRPELLAGDYQAAVGRVAQKHTNPSLRAVTEGQPCRPPFTRSKKDSAALAVINGDCGSVVKHENIGVLHHCNGNYEIKLAHLAIGNDDLLAVDGAGQLDDTSPAQGFQLMSSTGNTDPFTSLMVRFDTSCSRLLLSLCLS
jgi:hypothetical protein